MKTELSAQVHFATGCRGYQNGLQAVRDGKWPEARDNMSLNDVLKEEQTKGTQKPMVEQKGVDR